jgi:PHD/YefM family antitoxin component YafN of YafNO toxin-antitoxin module
MKTYDYAEVSSNFPAVFEAALKEDVLVERNDGSRFVIISYKKYKSPFENIKGLDKRVSDDEIIDMVRETRARM